MTKHYAHTDGTPNKKNWESLVDHSRNVGLQSGEFANKFGSDKWGRLVGYWHDIGKVQPKFQKRLLNRSIICSHAPAGAYLAYLRCNDISPTIAYAMAQIIGGHHGGLRDRTDMYSMLQAAKDNHPIIEKEMPQVFKDVQPPAVPDRIKLDDPISVDLWTRFLFSSLVDADRLKTEEYIDSRQSNFRAMTKVHHDKMWDMVGRFERKLSEIEEKCFQEGEAGKLVNILRHRVSQTCLAAAYGAQGAYSCTVPTGGGKTLAIMRFALHHALRHGLDRIIVVIPFTSIIDQNATVYAEALGAANVLEHHSNVDIEKREKRMSGAGQYVTYFANENWDIPVVVTTNVQFFESLFSRKPRECRKIHNIARSVIIFDEVQLFPRPYVSPIISVIKRLINEYDCSVVFSTATQPAFEDRFMAGGKGGIQSTEIIPSPEKLAEKLRRVEIHWPDECKATSWADLSKRIVHAGDQTLTIVNLRKDANDLARELQSCSEVPVFHLSALMCPAHRRARIKIIKEMLKNKQPCHVVSTQLIEAGVDIDFPIVFRAMIGLDSIAQAAGRCNREGNLPLGHLYLFYPESNPPAGILSDGLRVTENLLKIYGKDLDPLSPADQAIYFRDLYGSSCLDEHEIDKWKRAGDFSKVHDKFKIIPNETFTVFIPWGEEGNDVWLMVMRAEKPEKRHIRAMQPFTVQLYKNDLMNLANKGVLKQLFALEEMEEESSKEEKPIWYVEDMASYDENFGLSF